MGRIIVHPRPGSVNASAACAGGSARGFRLSGRRDRSLNSPPPEKTTREPLAAVDLRLGGELAPQQRERPVRLAQRGGQPEHIHEQPAIQFGARLILIDLIEGKELAGAQRLEGGARGAVLRLRERPHIERGDSRNARHRRRAASRLRLVRRPPVQQQPERRVAPQREGVLVIGILEDHRRPRPPADARPLRHRDDQGLRVETQVGAVVRARGRRPDAGCLLVDVGLEMGGDRLDLALGIRSEDELSLSLGLMRPKHRVGWDRVDRGMDSLERPAR